MPPHQIPLSGKNGNTILSNATAESSPHALHFDASDGSHLKSSLDCPESITFTNLLSLPESVHTYKTRPLETPPTFRLFVRQFAQRGLAVGDSGTLNARGTRFNAVRSLPLDPPVVCQVLATQPDQQSLLNVLEITVRARLVHSDGLDLVAATPAGQPLMGDVDQGAFTAQVFPPDEQSFFIFSELCVRPTGTFRLRFDALDRSLSSFQPLGSVYSRPFTVVQDKKDFADLAPSTELILAIADRGLKLRVIKVAQSQAAAKKKARLIEEDAPLLSTSTRPVMGPPQAIPPYPRSQAASTTPSPSLGDWSIPSPGATSSFNSGTSHPTSSTSMHGSSSSGSSGSSGPSTASAPPQQHVLPSLGGHHHVHIASPESLARPDPTSRSPVLPPIRHILEVADWRRATMGQEKFQFPGSQSYVRRDRAGTVGHTPYGWDPRLERRKRDAPPPD